MTERDHGDDRDYPDGAVGRYVREKWGAAPPRPVRAARPYVRPVEPPTSRPAPDPDTRGGDEDAADGDDAWAYQPDAPWRGGAESRRWPPAPAGWKDPAAPTGGSGSPDDPVSGGPATTHTPGPAPRERSLFETPYNESASRRTAFGDPAQSPNASPSTRGVSGFDLPPVGVGSATETGASALSGGVESTANGVAAPHDRGLGAARPSDTPHGRATDPSQGSAGATTPPEGSRSGRASAATRPDEPADTVAAEVPPDGSDTARAGGEDAGAAGPPPSGRFAVPRGWASDTPPDAEPERRGFTEASAAQRRGTSGHALTRPPENGSPTVSRATGTGPLPPVPPPARQAPTAPPRFGGPQQAPARPAPPLPRPTSRESAHWTDPVAVAAQEAQRARQPEGYDLSTARLLRQAKRPPQSGWRRMVYVLSGRMVNPGESPTDIRRRELTARVNQPLLGCYKIAMLSLKGGVGKTTMTATLGATFASLRGDRVVAVDANPDRGTLSQKIPLETSATVRNLLRDAQRVRRYTDVRAYTSQGPSRLEVLASEQDPAVSEAFSEEDYRRAVNLLEHFYNIVLTDCGTGLMHSAMYGVLGVADQLVIVSSGSIDGARSASATMDWLDAHGHGELVANSVVVINFVHRSRGGVDLKRVSEHFAARCRAVVRIPFDAHLEEGAEIDLDRLEPSTRMALLDLAANVADAFEGVHTL